MRDKSSLMNTTGPSTDTNTEMKTVLKIIQFSVYIYILFPNIRKRIFVKFPLTYYLLKKRLSNVCSLLASCNTRPEQLVPAMSGHG